MRHLKVATGAVTEGAETMGQLEAAASPSLFLKMKLDRTRELLAQTRNAINSEPSFLENPRKTAASPAAADTDTMAAAAVAASNASVIEGNALESTASTLLQELDG